MTNKILILVIVSGWLAVTLTLGPATGRPLAAAIGAAVGALALYALARAVLAGVDWLLTLPPSR